MYGLSFKNSRHLARIYQENKPCFYLCRKIRVALKRFKNTLIDDWKRGFKIPK